MTHRTYSPTLAPIPCSEHDGVSTATQDAGALFISPRPARLGGGVYIGTRKATTTPGHFARQYVALDRGAASRLLADLAVALAEVEEVPAEVVVPREPKVGDRVRLRERTHSLPVGTRGTITGHDGDSDPGARCWFVRADGEAPKLHTHHEHWCFRRRFDVIGSA